MQDHTGRILRRILTQCQRNCIMRMLTQCQDYRKQTRHGGLNHAGKRIKQYCQKNRGCGNDHPASASHGLSGYGRDGARMDRDGHDGARHYPSDFEPKVVCCFIQGKIQPLPPSVYSGKHSAASLLFDDSVLRYVHERLCSALYVWSGTGLFCEKNASVPVPLGFCPDGIAPWNAHPGHDSRSEVEQADKSGPHLYFHYRRRYRSVLVPQERNAGLFVLPDFFCFSGL